MLNIKIKKLRENYRFTQKQVADFLDIDRSTYAYYESGKTVPNIFVIDRLSELYKVSCDYLIKNSITYKNQSNMDDLISKTCMKERKLLVYFRMFPINIQNGIMDIMKAHIKEINA